MKPLLFLLCLFSITSCNLEDGDRYFYLNADLKAYFSYIKGSYWVYRDDSFNATDTLVITGYKDEIGREHFDSYIDHTEYLRITYTSTYCNAIINDNLYTSNLGCSAAERTYEKEDAPDTLSRREMDISCCTKSFGNGSNYSLLQEYTVNGVKYSNVLHYIDEFCVNTHHNGTTDTVKVEYFLAKNIGVVEKRYSSPTETQCWKLVSYHLQQ